MNAKVYKSTGSWYQVKDEAGKFWNARTKGVMKLDDITSTNPVAVGDEVLIDIENENDRTAVITKINERNNYIKHYFFEGANIRLFPHLTNISLYSLSPVQASANTTSSLWSRRGSTRTMPFRGR